MNIKSVFRFAVVIQLVLIILSFVGSVHFFDYLPESLQNYLSLSEEKSFLFNNYFLLIIVFPLLLTYLASIFGLFFFKSWAKKFYIVINIILLGFTPFFEPTVQHAAVSSLDSLHAASIGFVFALLLFCNVIPAKGMPNK